MDTAPAPEGLPPSLRFLKALVILLTITMIVGVIVVVSLIVIRFPKINAQGPALPSEIALPAGVTAAGVTFGKGWYAVVTTDDRILIFDGKSGALRQEMAITAK
jgi:hypothetical protein